mmetsp:Transcript_28651/g.66040  ORF Transcript_28651/g.66040 Transcript_28651/m.66040 type:complete len:118 (-) Transcript_28651:117-470(-)
MGKMDQATHALMMRGGFRYDAKKDRYFMEAEAVWDVEKRIAKGKKQYAVPATSVEEFLAQEEKMVDNLLKKLQDKAASEGKTSKPVEDKASKEAEAEADGEEMPKKKRKKEVAEEEE